MLVLILAAVLLLSNAIRILKEYERAVVFRLGRAIGVKGPGLILLIPIVDRMVKVDLRTVTLDVPPQDIITRDNVSMKVNAVVYFRVIDAMRAIIAVERFLYATTQLAQVTLRTVLGEVELDDLLAQREKINERLQVILDHETEAWGIKISSVQVKHLDLPQEMQRAMAKQAEAERERRARVINAEGEFQASQRLSEAARVIAQNPIALQLRFLQTLAEVATENNSTTLFPVPIDLFRHFFTKPEAGSPPR
jgi:regulator of protease activity HflC (stomatin/prohibitin superfamily)